MSLARVQELAQKLAGWRADIDAGKALDQAETETRTAVLEDLKRIVREQRRPGVLGDPILAVAAERAITFDDEELSRIRVAQQLKAQRAKDAVKAAHVAGRPQRWAALTPSVRAAYRAAEVAHPSMREAFFAFAEALSGDETGAPPASFEPENDPAMQAELQAEAHARHSSGLSG